MPAAITGVTANNICTKIISFFLLTLALCFGVIDYFLKAGTRVYSDITLKTNISVGYKGLTTLAPFNKKVVEIKNNK